MRQRTEQVFRAMLRHIDLGIDALEEENEFLAKKTTSELRGATAVDEMLAKLNQLALDVEFEIQLKKIGRTAHSKESMVPAVTSEVSGSPQWDRRPPIERRRKSGAPDVDTSLSQDRSPLQIRLEEYFREHPRNSED